MRTTMMTNEGSAATHTRLLLGAAAVMLLAAAAPRALRAETETQTWKECMDAEWKDYNGCLLDSATSFQRRVCDIFFEAGVTLCGAKWVGDVKRAASGGDGVS